MARFETSEDSSWAKAVISMTMTFTYVVTRTGGSIFDANLWLLARQLRHLAGDLSSWARIEDLWASYVIDALLGWDIRRSYLLHICP